jgi:GNS1/SUR4 family
MIFGLLLHLVMGPGGQSGVAASSRSSPHVCKTGARNIDAAIIILSSAAIFWCLRAALPQMSSQLSPWGQQSIIDVLGLGQPKLASACTAAIIYVVLTLAGRQCMASCSPVKLTWLQRAYNAFQIGANAYMVWGLSANFSLGNPFGFNLPPNEVTKHFLTLHYWSKFLDWIDTVLIVVRKKDSQLSFLHVFHHVSYALFMF